MQKRLKEDRLEEFYPYLLNLARNIAGRNDVEDLVQQTMRDAIRDLRNHNRENNNIKGYLGKVMQHAYTDMQDRQNATKRSARKTIALEGTDTVDPNIMDSPAHRDEWERVWKIIMRLHKQGALSSRSLNAIQYYLGGSPNFIKKYNASERAWRSQLDRALIIVRNEIKREEKRLQVSRQWRKNRRVLKSRRT